jgi:beta-xylosidase
MPHPAPIPLPVETAPAAAPWRPDLGDGTYRNPVLHADYSDPDVIRVGGDFWMTASSFNHVPGLPILHSRDLVNWSLVNHALPRLVPHVHFASPRHGGGVWAPAIRHHAGRYWIFYPDPDFGLYMLTADHPRKRWSEPHLVLAGQGLIDPCPLWDEDGRCHLVYAWARSRSGRSNVLTLQQLTPDGRKPVGEARDIIDGESLPGAHTLEGPKLYKRDGWYWVFAPAGGVATGYQAAFRARRIEGPYEGRVVLAQGDTPVNGPHQGAWVDTPAGEHWFLHFQEMPAYGRVVHLQPMRWRRDGWPEIGSAVDANGCGHPVLRHAKPGLPAGDPAGPASSDEFASPHLGYQWQWQGNPRPHWARVDPENRTLRLRCVPLAKPATHWDATHLLLQKFPAPEFTVEVDLRLDARRDGECAGLMVFGYDYAWIGLRRVEGRLQAVFALCRNAHEGGVECTPERHTPPPGASGNRVRLRLEVMPGARCRFALGWGDDDPVTMGPIFFARSSRWVGAKFGLFASATLPDIPSGKATIHRFRVT